MFLKKNIPQNNIKILIIPVFILIFLSIIKAATIQYHLISIENDMILMGFSITGSFSSNEQNFFFAYPEINTSKSAISVIAQTNASSEKIPLPVKKHTLIQTTRTGLQWCSFLSKRNLPPEGTITIKYNAPIFRGISKKDVTIKNGILRVPASLHLAKIKVEIPQLPFSIGLRIDVSEDGIYSISASQLRSSGVPISKIPSHTYRLFNKNREIPIYISNSQHAPISSDDYLLFYGKYLRGNSSNFEQFSNTNVYWLTWDNNITGSRVVEISGEQRQKFTDYSSGLFKALNFPDTVHIETDTDIRYLGDVDNPPEQISEQPYPDTFIDNWYWGFIGEEELTNYKFSLPAPGASGTARMHISLMGLSSLDNIDIDHQIKILLNNDPVGAQNTASWDGQRSFIFTSDPFPVTQLKAAENEVSFLCPSRGFPDRSALNWIRIEYPRSYLSVNNSIRFKNDPDGLSKLTEYQLSGFNTDQLELWDIDRNIIFTDFSIIKGTGKYRNLYTIAFQDSTKNNTTYFAQSKQLRLTPSYMVMDTIKNDWNKFANSQHITISSDSFKTEIEPLIDLHNKRGLKAIFVDINDIYNRFSYGIRDPESIRSFLKYVFSISSSNLPCYLLLGGDTSHDLDKKNKDKNIIPTHLSRIPQWGPAADDGYFATIYGNDAFADLSVGRFPAQNRQQMATMVQKTIRYIRTPNRGFWRDNLLLLGGGENSFTGFNEEAVNEIIKQKMNITRIEADSGSQFYKDGSTAPKIISDKINSGVFLVNFNGHGGGNIWSDNNFFGYKDLSRLFNGQWGNGGKLPFIFSFTCLTGFFESMYYRSLGEEFLRTDHNGCIGFYGASAYTSSNGNMLLNKLALEAALNSNSQTIGEIIDFCEMSMLVQYGSQHLPLIRQYNLLGDPALPWIITPDTLKMTLNSSSLKHNDSLRLNCYTSPITSGNLRILVNSNNDQVYKNINTITNGSFSGIIPVKRINGAVSGSLRAYAWNDSTEIRGLINFSKDTLMVVDVQLAPENPFFGDSIFVSCRLLLDSSLLPANVYCRFALGSSSSHKNKSFSGTRLISAGNNKWITQEKIPLTYNNNINERLLLYFRATSSDKSIESELFSFHINGRPDLLFTDDSIEIQWFNDSLRITTQILNTGNASAPPFHVHFFWNNGDLIQDTIFTLYSSDSLAPGKFINFSHSLPDTQGSLFFGGWINYHNRFLEINQFNNRVNGHSDIKYKDLATPSDTLSIACNALSLVPVQKFNQKKRVFAFFEQVNNSMPLETGSKWLPLACNHSIQIFTGSRPSDNNSDSLLWIFNTQASINNTASNKHTIMSYDTLIGRWKYAGGNIINNNSIQFKTTARGPLAPAVLNDLQPPDIQVAAAGRFLDFTDYAARNKPFSIIISDPSGIDQKSIKLLLNGQTLDSSCFSLTNSTETLNNLSITAYPRPQHKIDSLQISAMDLAGNITVKTVSYMPGEELSIKFLACHPNPFTARQMPNGSIRNARFAFLLTDVADNVSLTIYTVSGKSIQSWSLSSIIGYQEIRWDGRDRDGARIANGTYYAKLVAKNGQKKVSKIIRIAKLEGYY